MTIGAALPFLPNTCAASNGACANNALQRTSVSVGDSADTSAQVASGGTAMQLTGQQPVLESVIASLRRALESVVSTSKTLDRVDSAAQIGVHASSKQKAVIEIRTQEGDVIRIRYSHRTSIDARGVQVAGAQGQGNAYGASIRERERLDVSVDGNLNADELAAVQATLDKIDHLAEAFFSGDMAATFAQTNMSQSSMSQSGGLNADTAQLANVTVRLSSRDTVVSSLRSSQRLQTTNGLKTTNPPKPESNAASEPTNGTLDTTASPTKSTPVALPVIAPAPEPIADPIATLPQTNVAAPSVDAESDELSSAAQSNANESSATPAVETTSQPVTQAASSQSTSSQSTSSQPTSSPSASVQSIMLQYAQRVASVLVANAQEIRMGFTVSNQLKLLLANIETQLPSNTDAVQGATNSQAS